LTPLPVPLFDTATPLAPLRPEIDAAIARVLDERSFILGPNVGAFEAELAAYCGARHAIGVANGTEALTIALRALGVGPGDEVVVPSFTFYASAEAIPPTGATPVFCDVEPDTMCVSAETVRAALTPRTKAVIAVHLFGNLAPVAEIEALGVPVLEDAAQAAGTIGPGGTRPGALGTIATFSFFPSKNLGCFGDGGAVTTSDTAIAETVRTLRFHGSKDKQTYSMVGHNSRLDELQAALLRVQLPHLDGWADGRRAAGRHYEEAGLGELVRLPTALGRPAWHLYVVRDEDPDALAARLAAAEAWSLGCIAEGVGCGVVWNTLALAVLTGVLSTLLGLAFALLAARAEMRATRSFRALAILPLITPPFVVSLALIVLFGRTGIVTQFLSASLGLPRSRWIYGLPGVLLAQLLSFTPIAFMLLEGAVRAIGPSLEEAAATMGARRFAIFRTVTWPLLRPALAAAFLLGFVESLADFGNPLVLGGDFDVLSTRIFFAIAGARNDPGRAAALALLLLALTFGAFALQAAWLGRRRYVTVTGKGDSGVPAPLPRGLAVACGAVAFPWMAFTAAVYGVILAGGFVRDIGRGDTTFTWRHFVTAFEVEWASGPVFRGAAWDSLFTTVEIAAIAAPLTAGLGVLMAWLLARQSFPGRRALEFMTMLSFAIPGTVVGVSYIMAFNVPPIELTGTGLILVLSFVFRNLPVGVRGGIAALAQIDRSLDEASSTMGGGAAATLRRVVLPLLRPAVVAALAFSFVHAMTAVSAVIFLVSARYNLATVYIVGRVEAGEIALAIAYSTVLIVIMLAVVLGIERLVGRAQLGRRAVPAAAAAQPVLRGGA